MTRARKIDPAILEREYVYDTSNPPISFTGLAEKYGLARSGVADKGVSGRWHEKRAEFRKALGEKVVENMTDKWASIETATRERMLSTAVKSLDKYDELLDEGKIRITARDAQGWMAVIRTLISDIAVNSEDRELLDPGKVVLPAEQYEVAAADIKRLLASLPEEGLDDSLSDGDTPE